MTKTRILIHNGKTTGIYDDKLSPQLLANLGGTVQITRASHVEAPLRDLDKIEFDVDLSPSNGPKITGFTNYKDAVAAEVAWLQEHTLNPNSQPEQTTNPTEP